MLESSLPTVLGWFKEVTVGGCFGAILYSWLCSEAKWAQFPGWEAAHTWMVSRSFTVGMRQDTHLFFSGQSFLQMPQTIGKGLHQRKWLCPIPQRCSPCTFCRISALLDTRSFSKSLASLCVQIHSHVPAAVTEQSIYWWYPNPIAELS